MEGELRVTTTTMARLHNPPVIRKKIKNGDDDNVSSELFYPQMN